MEPSEADIQHQTMLMNIYNNQRQINIPIGGLASVIRNSLPEYQPIPIKRTYKRRKPALQVYRQLCIGLACLLVLFGYLLVMVLKGNAALKARAERPTVIMPNGGMEYSK